MSVRIITKERLEYLERMYPRWPQYRIWQNPFYTKDFAKFWLDIELERILDLDDFVRLGQKKGDEC